jgi:hypothetical protein
MESQSAPVGFDSGNIYGLAEGGQNGDGVAYELIPGSNGSWREKIVHSFTAKNDGSVGYGNSVILDQAGNVYGGAADGPHDYGIVFELVHEPNGAGTEKILYGFIGPKDGVGPFPDLVFDRGGNLYGAANFDAPRMWFSSLCGMGSRSVTTKIVARFYQARWARARSGFCELANPAHPPNRNKNFYGDRSPISIC